MNILIAVDGSEYSEAALREVIRTSPRDAQIRLMHVIETLPVVESWAYAVDWQKLMQDQRSEAERFVAEGAKALRDAGFTVNTLIKEGVPKSLVVEEAAKWPADVIVVGSHGRKGISRFLLGSVSEGIARHGPCSVLIVRSRNQSAA
jgi:nucleotide-binding universal stress UspA family protein